MPIACSLITHLPMKVEQARNPSLRNTAALIYRQLGMEKKTVLDQSSLARETVIGMTLEEALARCPYAAILEADEPAYQEIWGQMLDALENRSPIVEDADLGIAYVDLHGLEPLYGTEAALTKVLINAFPSGYRARIGVAEGKFTAYIAALRAEPGSAFRAPRDAAAFLSQLPILRLPAAWETKARLLGFGLETIGSVARLPLDAMQGEFGKEGAWLWHLARGEDDERLVPRSHEERLKAETTFATPSVSLPVIMVALEGLSVQAFSGLRGRFARVAGLEGRVVRKPPWSKRIAFKEPIGDANRALRLLRDRLSQLVLPGPLETLALTLTDLTGESGRQESLFRDVQRQADLDSAIRQLRARIGGQSQIYQVRGMQPWSRIPERRSALVPYEP